MDFKKITHVKSTTIVLSKLLDVPGHPESNLKSINMDVLETSSKFLVIILIFYIAQIYLSV